MLARFCAWAAPWSIFIASLFRWIRSTLGYGFANSCALAAAVLSQARFWRAIQPVYPLQGTSICAHCRFRDCPATRTFPLASYATRPFGASRTSAEAGTIVHSTLECGRALQARAGVDKCKGAITANAVARHKGLLLIRTLQQWWSPRRKKAPSPSQTHLTLSVAEVGGHCLSVVR